MQVELYPQADHQDGFSRRKRLRPKMSDFYIVAKMAPPEAQAEKPSSALVQIDGVSKHFGFKTALKDVSFSVPSGQICGLLGSNGAGKTTLFRLLMEILKATGGTLLIDGRDAFEDRVEVKRLIGFLPDEPVYYSYLSAHEILELSAAMHGLDVRAAMNRISPIISKLRLLQDINNYAEDYSRGMKKKLGLLLAMLHQRSFWSSTSPPMASTSNPLAFFMTSFLKLPAREPRCLLRSLALLGRTRSFPTRRLAMAGRATSSGRIASLVACGGIPNRHLPPITPAGSGRRRDPGLVCPRLYDSVAASPRHFRIDPQVARGDGKNTGIENLPCGDDSGICTVCRRIPFRGLLFRALDREWGGWRAVAGSAAFLRFTTALSPGCRLVCGVPPTRSFSRKQAVLPRRLSSTWFTTLWFLFERLFCELFDVSLAA